MSNINSPQISVEPARPDMASEISTLIYESSHELLDFMFRNRASALAGLESLLSKPGGHFGYKFARVMLLDGQITGVELGYDSKQLNAQEFVGSLNMLKALPISAWPHLLFTVSRALKGYVPLPSEGAYYINNIAVDSAQRGLGLGQKMLDDVVNAARAEGYTKVELDVTEVNEAAIRFYQRYGFQSVGQTGSSELMEKYGLPKLNRMRLFLAENPDCSVNSWDNPGNPILINDVTKLNPVLVSESYAPGSIEQLQSAIRTSDKPVSIGGGRFSMGGQVASADTMHIDMRGLNRIISINPDEKLVRVETGIRWRELQAAVEQYGLAIKVMQTYSDFSVGGSISVNCHGRYVGLGPLIYSLRSIRILLQDGEILDASPEENAEIFYASVGGYGALGIIVEAELALADDVRIERISRKMPLSQYLGYFTKQVRDNDGAVFHNADMVPPHFKKVRAITWQRTEKAVNTRQRVGRRNLFLAEKYMLWAITETPAGHLRREYIYEPLLYLRPKITTRNDEANYEVAELEPLSRHEKTYVLQEYFVPVERLEAFSMAMASILNRYSVQVVNVSIRHAHADKGSLMAWAREEVFALVLYYKQGTSRANRERVAVWTRELIDAVIKVNGTYYLPYQPHARLDQFHKSYPNAKTFFSLKQKLDLNYRFRNSLWEKYYQADQDEPLFGDKLVQGSEFLSVYGDVHSRDDFYRFLQNIYHLYPEHLFHQLIIDVCENSRTDQEIYEAVAKKLPDIKPFLSELTYALPALAKQKKEMVRQTESILPAGKAINGYLEIGSTGRYVKKLSKALSISGSVCLTNDIVPDNSPPEVMERGGIKQVGHFFDLANYEPITEVQIPSESLDLVTCYIGLHHCPREKLSEYLASIHRVLRPGGYFVLRDHDAGSDKMRTFCALVHTVFNAGLGVSWEEDRKELRLFEGVDFWVDSVTKAGFDDLGSRLLQENDPSLNTLMCFVREG